jgi:hypothetical protein
MQIRGNVRLAESKNIATQNSNYSKPGTTAFTTDRRVRITPQAYDR